MPTRPTGLKKGKKSYKGDLERRIYEQLEWRDKGKLDQNTAYMYEIVKVKKNAPLNTKVFSRSNPTPE